MREEESFAREWTKSTPVVDAGQAKKGAGARGGEGGGGEEEVGGRGWPLKET